MRDHCHFTGSCQGAAKFEINSYLKEKFANTFKFYEWSKFHETSLPDRESFYAILNIENISEPDYEHGKNVWGTSWIKKLGNYRDLYVQCDTFLLLCIRNYESTLEIMKKTNNLQILHILIKIIYMGFPVLTSGFKWVETDNVNKDFIKNDH